jgi:hypothetical protein
VKTTLKILLSMTALTLVACGGGGPGSSAPASASTLGAPVTATQSTAAADLALAARLYKGDSRTPAGFDIEARPPSVIGTLSTRHLKNSDFATGPQAAGPAYELCTNDMGQAIDWSEQQATWNGEYSDLVEVRSTAKLFEVLRVPRADVTAMIRQRVFRCDYLDRSGSDLRADDGTAGNMNLRPLTSTELESLAEYLWRFTTFNNSDYAVESSTTSTSSGSVVNTIRMGQLVRASAGGCDTVQIMDWSHTMDAATGALTRTLVNVRTFRATNSAGAVELCAAG